MSIALNGAVSLPVAGKYSIKGLLTQPGIVALQETQAMFNVLQNYGSDAHLYWPGVGTFDGLDVQNYFNTAGTTVATVDQTVGRVNDAAGKFGPELVKNGNFSAGATDWTLGVGWSVSGGVASATASVSTGLEQAMAFEVGKTYVVSFAYAISTGGLKVYRGQGSQAVTGWLAGTGTLSTMFTCIAGGAMKLLLLSDTTATTATIDNISVKEVIGTHATQGTTGAMPTLRKGAVNLLLQTSFPNGTAGVNGSGAVAPTSWTFLTGGGNISFPMTQYGTVGVRCSGASASFRPCIYQTMNVATNTTYIATVKVAAIDVAGYSLNDLVNIGNFPAGSVISCVKNGVGVSGAASVSVGDVISTFITTSSTAGTCTVRIGGGANGGSFGDVTVTQPQFELGSVATPYAPTTTYTASNGVGNYCWEFNGSTNYLTLDKPLFGMADDHCVIAGAKNASSSAVSKNVFSQRNSALDNSIVCQLDFTATNQYPRAIWRDDAGLIANLTHSVSSLNTPVVLSAISSTALKTLRVNGVQVASSTTSPTTTTITAATIGCNARTTTEFFAGNLYPLIAIKGTVSPADVVTLERFITKLCGV